MGFPKQEFWSGLSLPSPGDLPNPGLNSHLLRLLLWRHILYPSEPSGKHQGVGPVPRIFLPVQEPQEKQVQSLGWEDPLEEEMAAHSSILAWRIPWTEEPGGLQSIGLQRVEHN